MNLNMNVLKNVTVCVMLVLALLVAACDATSTGSGAASTAVKQASSPAPLVAGEEIAVLETTFGKIEIRLYPDVAPRHVESFKKYINEKFYDGLAFHRIIPGLVIQAGNPATRNENPDTWLEGENTPLPNLNAEFSTRPYVRGTLGAARKGDPHSASSQFFICLTRNEEWDGQYTVFGEVISGMNAADIIAGAPTAPGTQRPAQKVLINRAYLEKYTGQ
jgi:peptidyl-prolyl cis-trans isomerase B (cyclophilin B)